MNALLLGLVLFAADPSLQLNLSGGATGPTREERTPDGEEIKRDASQLAAYLGVAFEDRRNRWAESGLFYGFGSEVTIDGAEGPYQWSLGLGPRVGRVWRSGRMSPLPEGYVFLRATPFVGFREIAQEDYLHDEERSLTKAGAGVRFGVGFTLPVWSATVLEGLASGPDLGNVNISSGSSFGGDAAGVVACFAIGVAIILLNHAELTYEVYNEYGLPTDHRIGIRFGTGF